MKYLVALLAAVYMCAMFVPIASGLSCYKCSWTDKNCTVTFDVANGKTESCGGAAEEAPGAPAAPSAPAAPDAPAAPAPPGEAPPADAPPAEEAAPERLKVMRSKQLHSQLSEDPKADTFHCFAAVVTMNGTSTVERGCKSDDKTTDCVAADKDAEVTCTVCKTDNCNGGVSVTASALLCVFVPAILVGQIFFQTK